MPGIRRAQSSEARIRHGLPESPAPCPEAAFGRVHTGRTQAQRSPGGEPSRLAIVQAIRPGCRRARGQRAYLRAVIADPVIAALRADSRRTVLELARILARHASWRDMTTWRPRDLACAEIGSSRDPSKPLSISAYKRARQVLEEQGFLGLVAQGWTSALRASVLDDRTATSAVFVLTIPHRKERLPTDRGTPPVNGPLTRISDPVVKSPHAREARAEVKGEDPEVKGEKARAPRGQSPLPPSSVFPLGAVPQDWGVDLHWNENPRLAADPRRPRHHLPGAPADAVTSGGSTGSRPRRSLPRHRRGRRGRVAAGWQRYL